MAVAALVTRRPVKITLSRAETLATAVKRHPFELDYRVATDDEGMILAVDAKLLGVELFYTTNAATDA